MPDSTLVNSTASLLLVIDKDALLFVKRRVIHLDGEHEAVELGLGQRIGAFLLDRVLRGDDEERIGQLVGVLAGGHFAFLHAPAAGRPASWAACG